MTIVGTVVPLSTRGTKRPRPSAIRNRDLHPPHEGRESRTRHGVVREADRHPVFTSTDSSILPALCTLPALVALEFGASSPQTRGRRPGGTIPQQEERGVVSGPLSVVQVAGRRRLHAECECRCSYIQSAARDLGDPCWWMASGTDPCPLSRGSYSLKQGECIGEVCLGEMWHVA